MFNLGYKETILNGALSISGTTPNITWKIPGFSTFKAADCVVTAARSMPAVNYTGRIADAQLPTPAIGDNYEIRIHYVSQRYQSEFARVSNQGFGRPFVLLVTATGTTAASLRGDILAAWATYVSRGNTTLPPFVLSASTTNTQINGTIPSVDIVRAEIRKSTVGSPSVAFTKMALSAETKSFEGLGLGKFLEESRKVGNTVNTDPFRIHNNGSDMVDIRGTYSVIDIVHQGPLNGYEPHDFIGHQSANEDVSTKKFRFTIYVNEAVVQANAALGTWLDDADDLTATLSTATAATDGSKFVANSNA